MNKNADLDVLHKPDSTLTQVIQAVTNLEKNKPERRISFGLSSSVTIELLGLYLRKYGLLSGTEITIHHGNYDDPVGDVDLFMKAGVEHMVLLPFLDALMPSFEAQLDSLPPTLLADKECEIRNRYRLVFEKAKSFKTIYLGSFHRLEDGVVSTGKDSTANVLAALNQALRQEAAGYPNIRIIDTENIIRTVGQHSSFDSRFYFRNKAPYTGSYFNEMARRISAASRGFGTHFYKVLVLDCDNTLWGGVIGEDLIEGIKLGPYDYPGNIFWRMQHEFAKLESNGVLLCLCSKNNPPDIEEVFRNKPEMVLKSSQIVIKKVNWNDKPSNIREIAMELNVSLDSIIFLDDSKFECEAVCSQLPSVKTFQVPTNLSDYPRLVSKISELFLAGGVSTESRDKTEQYRLRAAALELRGEFDTQDDYLASLKIKVELNRNSEANATRISELSMKSNQFNLTTQRFSEVEVLDKMHSPDSDVFSLIVTDKFGTAGLTGVVFMRYSNRIAHVDNFLMSCRVLGRGVETSFWTHIANYAAQCDCVKLQSTYIPSFKNIQVADFYDRLEIPLTHTTDKGTKHYSVPLTSFKPPVPSWIELIYVE